MRSLRSQTRRSGSVDQIEIAVLAADQNALFSDGWGADDWTLRFKLPFDGAVARIDSVEIGVGAAAEKHVAADCG